MITGEIKNDFEFIKYDMKIFDDLPLHIKSDKHIKDYSEKKYQWAPEILKEAKLVPGNIYTLRGPRQVGKTTLVKLIVKSLLARNVPVKSIFYATCDALIN